MYHVAQVSQQAWKYACFFLHDAHSQRKNELDYVSSSRGELLLEYYVGILSSLSRYSWLAYFIPWVKLECVSNSAAKKKKFSLRKTNSAHQSLHEPKEKTIL